jgi:hypothetical protein
MIGAILWLRRAAIGAGLVSLAIAGLSVASPARAQLSIGDYVDLRRGVTEKDKNRIDKLYTFTLGFLDGIETTNAALVEIKAEPEFCLPQSRTLKTSDIMLTIDEELKLRPAFLGQRREESVALVAVLGLKRRFPCK